ncbi:StsB family radical SAM/SPASM domain sactipeptide maturase [Micromonospora echinofusca]|uniref:Radical SAM additional 4Fe4S-binding SPASM domain-containing protein n=1 Tax=Micromonospora echinofusca TaxID=47858 RepID=A0A1C5GHC9_MICEH|nr:StsB family radical SAM/SPASM domain sactipeptide maturase [Micromonospora echinofusca]SCG18982.1 radical SAM additional 4Fe4S-binding SPASM domain-containing protein [Micromonospora echinofusca]
MRGHLVRNRSRFDVPEDLTYFVHGESHLVINPQVGARCVLTTREFGVLRALVTGTPLEPDEATERTLGKLILQWIVYFNGHRPTVTVSESPLNTAYYAITDGCNLRCPYCYASSEKCLPGELNTAESLDLVDQVAAMGTRTIIFTGGEPMLRKDLFQVVEHAKSRGLLCNVITNATMIRSAQIAQRFAELFDAVTISLDGGTAETHDRTRGKGSFAKTHQAVRLLNDAGVEPRINHIVTSDNIDELEDFGAFIAGLRVHSVRLMNHSQLGRGVDDEYDFGWADHLRVQQLVWTSPIAGPLRPDGPRPVTPCSVKGNCGLGGNEIYINSLGDVYPCKLVTGRAEHAGNIRRQPLAEIFASPVLGAMRRSTVYGGEFHADCGACYIRSNCGGGCRATHMSLSGDLRRNDRHYCRILRHGLVTQLWQESGVSRAEIAANDEAMTVPRRVADGAVHEVYDQWKTYVAPPAPAIRAGQLIPVTPVPRRSDSVPAHQ